jgi:hypothetical protein
MTDAEQAAETLSNIVVGFLALCSLFLFIVWITATSLSWVHFKFGDPGVMIAASLEALYVLFWLRVVQRNRGR